MSSRWPETPFSSLAVLSREAVRPEDAAGFPYVGLEHIGEGTLQLTGVGVAEDASSLKSRFRQGDILFGKLRPYFRKVVRAPFDGICSTDIWVVRPRTGVNRDYLFYLMASPDFLEPIIRASEGTKMPRAKWDYAAALTFPVPPPAEQQSISGILASLDDKIEQNRRTADTLDEIAKTLFSLLIEQSEDGGRGRRSYCSLEDVALLTKLTVNPQTKPNRLFEHYSLPAFDTGRLPQLQCGEDIKSQKTLIPNDAVLLSKLNPQFPRVWMPQPSGEGDAIASTEFLVLTPRPGIPRSFLYCAVSSAEFTRRLQTYVTGTSGSHQRVKPQTVLQMQVPCVTRDLLVEFDRAVGPVLGRAAHAIAQGHTLREIRDTLLPRLLDGRIEVPASTDGEAS